MKTTPKAMITAMGIALASASGLFAQTESTTTSFQYITSTGNLLANAYNFQVGPLTTAADITPNLTWNVQHTFTQIVGTTITTVTPAKMQIYVLGMGFGPIRDPFLVRSEFRINNGPWERLWYRDNQDNPRTKFITESSTRENEPRPDLALVERELPAGTSVDFRIKGWNNNGHDSPSSLSEFWSDSSLARRTSSTQDWRARLTTPNNGLPSNQVRLRRNNEDIGVYAPPAFDQVGVDTVLGELIDRRDIRNRNDDRVVNLGPSDFMYLTELNVLDDARADMQDCVILTRFSEPQEIVTEGETVTSTISTGG